MGTAAAHRYAPELACTRAIVLLVLLLACATGKMVTIQNTAPRLDSDSNVVDAHDGKLIRVDGTYYLYGTTYRSCGGSAPCQFNATFSCYSSRDLTSWTKLSDDILPYSDPRNRAGYKDNMPLYGPGVQIRYRPHAVYNPNTKMYVLWYDWRNKGGGYGDNNHSAQGAAVSVKPGGPFVVVTPNATLAGPIDYRGDLDVFVDDDADHTAYLIYTAGSAQTMTIEQLSKNYTTSTLRSTWDPSGASKEDGGGYQAATGCGPYTRQGSCGSAAARDANSTDYWNTLSGGLLHLGVDAGAEAPAMWKNGSTYFASFDQNCGFCPAGSGAWIHSASHPLGPWKLHININRKLLPGCEPSSRPAAANGECGRGGYQYGARPAPPQTQTGGEECWQHLAGNYRGSVGPGMGGDDAIVITAEKAATATEAQYVATGFKWGPGVKHFFTAFKNETTTALPGCRSARLGAFNGSAPACSAILFGAAAGWCLESYCGKCLGWPRCTVTPPVPPPSHGGRLGTVVHAQQAGVWPVALADGSTRWLWAGDLWHSTPDGRKGHDKLYIGPIEHDADGMPLPLKWVDSFELDIDVKSLADVPLTLHSKTDDSSAAAAVSAPTTVKLANEMMQLEVTSTAGSDGGNDSPSLTTFCGGISGPGLMLGPSVHSLSLSCNEPGATISNIDFASYGTFGCVWKAGNCQYDRFVLLHNWTAQSCTVANVLRMQNTSCQSPGIAASLFAPRCVGQAQCSFDCSVDGKDFPRDPCTGVYKSIFVQAQCSHGTGKVAIGSAAASSKPVNTSFISALRLNAEASVPGAGFTRSIVDGDATHANRLSHTGIWAAPSAAADATFYPATGGRVVYSDASSVTVDGIALGEIAKEEWKIRLPVGSDTLTWQVSRTFLEDTDVHDDWVVSLGLDADGATNAGFTQSAQMPGWLDTDMELDRESENAAGFRKVYPTGGQALQRYWYALESKNSNQNITWSPSGMELATEATCVLNGEACSTRFVFAQAIEDTPSTSATCSNKTAPPGNPKIDCTAEAVVCPNGDQVNGGPTQIRVGLTTSARGKPARLRTGDVVVVSWSLRLQAARDVAPLVLEIPSDPALAGLSRRLSAQFSNPVVGWWAVTNSPASVTCLHELSWFPMAWSILNKPIAKASPTIHDAFAKQLQYYGEVSHQSPFTGASGYIQGRWGMSCPENFTSFGEANPNFILSAYYHAVNTGERAYIKKLWPILQHAMHYITDPVGMNALAHGIPYAKGTTGRLGEWVPANWYDEVNFGGWDSIVCVYAVQAMEAMRRLSHWIGREASETAGYAALVANARVAYNARFWDEEKGWYREWVDVDDRPRSTGYVWPQFVAMTELANISSAAQQRRTFAAIDASYARLRSTYNITAEQQWCTPDNLNKLNPHDCHGECGPWPAYESGRCFLWTSGWEMHARARHEGADAAFALWQRMLGGAASNYSRFRTTAFWQQNNAWGTFEDRKPHGGSDVLLDQIVTVWGFLRGAFGIEPTLSALRIVHPPAKRLQGATWSFLHLGKTRTATVTGGKVVLS